MKIALATLSIISLLSVTNIFAMEPSRPLTAEQQRQLREAIETPMPGTRPVFVGSQGRRLPGFEEARQREGYVRPPTPPVTPRTTGIPGEAALQESYYGQQNK